MTDDIILKFTNADLLIDDSAYKKIVQQENSLEIADSLIEDISTSNDDLLVLTGSMVDQFIQRSAANPNPYEYPNEDHGFQGLEMMLLTLQSYLKANSLILHLISILYKILPKNPIQVGR